MKTEEKIKELEKQIEELKKESQKEEMEQWFKSLLNGLEIKINDDNPYSVYYKKNGNVIFELYQCSEKILYCDYTLVWAIFYNKYNLNYDETQAFIKRMVEQHLKLCMVTPLSSIFSL
jgi:restriction endonuclease S subunit